MTPHRRLDLWLRSPHIHSVHIRLPEYAVNPVLSRRIRRDLVSFVCRRPCPLAGSVASRRVMGFGDCLGAYKSAPVVPAVPWLSRSEGSSAVWIVGEMATIVSGPFVVGVGEHYADQRQALASSGTNPDHACAAVWCSRWTLVNQPTRASRRSGMTRESRTAGTVTQDECAATRGRVP